MKPRKGGIPMSNGARQMPGHIEAAYKEVVNNIFFFKRQQWVTTNYTILVYAAIFIVSAKFFTRTDLARGLLGLLTFLTFFYHLYMIKLFQDAITSFRDRLAWIYRSYFSADEQVGLNLSLRPDPYWHQAAVPLGLIAVSRGRSCLDFDLFVLSPMNTLVRTRRCWIGDCKQQRDEANPKICAIVQRGGAPLAARTTSRLASSNNQVCGRDHYPGNERG